MYKIRFICSALTVYALTLYSMEHEDLNLENLPLVTLQGDYKDNNTAQIYASWNSDELGAAAACFLAMAKKYQQCSIESLGKATKMIAELDRRNDKKT